MTRTRRGFGRASALIVALAIAALGSRRDLWPILPALTALALAFTSRRPALALFSGALFGALLGADLDPLLASQAAWQLARQVIWDWGHARIVIFTVCLGIVAEYTSLTAAGRLARWVSSGAVSAVRAQLLTWFLGLVVFVDDYVNSMLVGSASRPLFDRAGVSREKLAFLVDATAAPVTSLVPVSTWIGVELAYLSEYYGTEGGPSPLYVFTASIPFRFYPLLMLAFAALGIVMTREFGPMRHARAREQASSVELGSERPYTWYQAGLPLLTVLLVVFGSLFLDASRARASKSLGWGRALAEADSLAALLVGSLAGVLLALALRLRQSPNARSTFVELSQGARTMLSPCLILLGAWALSASLKQLGAGEVVASWVMSLSVAQWVPALVFGAAAVASFVTGTSWGTMAIVFPIAIPLIQGMPEASEPLELATVGAVLAGAVFGDHCSPISDTTIMSAAAAGCDPMAHVLTQLPYALVVGVVSMAATLWVGLVGTAPVWVLAASCLVLALVIRLIGHRTAVLAARE